MRKSLFFLVVVTGLFAFGNTAFAQDREEPKLSSLQIINATSVPSLALKRDDTLAYPVFAQGRQISGGPIERQRWLLDASPSDSNVSISTIEILEDRESVTLVIVGDFSELKVEAIPSPIPAGFERINSEILLRAGFLRFDNSRVAGGAKAITVCNAVPDGELAVSLNSAAAVVLPYGESFSAPQTGGDQVSLRAALRDEHEHNLTFQIRPDDEGLVVVFFRDAATEKVKFVVGRNQTVASVSRQIEASAEPEEPSAREED